MPDRGFEVCIIEDDESMSRALRRLVTSFGYGVHVYNTATSFIEDNRYGNADCILLDVNLPDMTGLELQKFLNGQAVNVPIVFLTGHGDVPMSATAMQAGAIDFLQKPVSETALLKALTRAISIRQANQSQEADRDGARQLIASLTDRELQVFRCVLTGAMNKQIAAHLSISEKTVKVHRGHMMKKLGAKSIVDLVGLSDLGQVEPDHSLKR